MWKNIQVTGIVLTGVLLLSLASNLNKTSENHLVTSEVESYEPIVVLELFTSQGCSSCPSADRLLQKAKEAYKKEVFALSYHVDYWNYIGWNDPFSKAVYAEKQQKYNVKFKNDTNYTPQLVVNGREHFVGSNFRKMQSSIDTYIEKKSTNNIAFKDVNAHQEKISFSYEIQGSLKNRKIRTLIAIDERSTIVNRGENKNRTLTNSNIVVAELSTKIKESNGSIEIGIPETVNPSDKLYLIVLVENYDHDITGATKQLLVR